MKTHALAPYLQRFFTERLGTQLKASPNTIISYRDTFRLLLRYAAEQLKKAPTALQIADIDADLVGLFLAHIEKMRSNAARSRNTRLAAIRSFFKYAAVNEPQLLHHCQRVLAMPSKRHEKRVIDYMTRDEIEAVIAAPDVTTWYGRRDRAILVLTLQTGLRVTELITLSCSDIALGAGAHVRCMGKGRKERATPIRKDSVKVLKAWLVERAGAAEEPLFVSNRGARLSRDAVERMVRAHVTTASKTCRSLRTKRVTPHVLRHSAAMQLLQNGVDRTVNALWLGHESVETTQMYIHADMQIKEKAMARTRPVDEVALDALAIAYEARSRFEGIRSRFVQEHEYEGIDHVEVGNVQYQVGHREAQRSPYAVLKRLKNNSDCFDKVSDIEPKFMAIFGAETQAYFELLYEATTIVRVSANALFEDAVIEHDPSDQVTRERLRKLRMDVFASKGKFEDEDRVGQKLLEFQARIEELCRPIVDATFGRRKGRKKH